MTASAARPLPPSLATAAAAAVSSPASAFRAQGAFAPITLRPLTVKTSTSSLSCLPTLKRDALSVLASSPLCVTPLRTTSVAAHTSTATHTTTTSDSSSSHSHSHSGTGAGAGSSSNGNGSGKGSGKRTLSRADLLTGVKAALIGAAGYGILTQDGGMFTDPAELTGGRVCFSFLGLRLVNVRGSYYLAFGDSAIRIGPEHLITAINSVVFLMWRVPALQSFMEKHFMTSYSAVMSGRWHTLLTAAFSHHSFFHILFNSMALLSVSSLVSRHWDFAKFCSVWAGSAAFSSAVQVFGGAAVATAMLRTGHAANIPQIMAPMLGASGAVGALISYICLTYPKTRFTVMFAIETSAGSLLPCLAAFDIAGLAGTAMGFFTSPFGHLAHLGGYLFGLGVYKWDQRNRPRRW